MNTAIDISQYSGEVTQAQMQAVRQAGCSRVIVALNNLPLAQRQLKAASSAGMEVEAYIYLYFAQSVQARVSACLAAIEGFGVRRVWVDCEDERHTLNAQSLAQRVRLARDAVVAGGYETGIYTAAWWWNKWMPGVTEFSTLPLWDAFWDKDDDLDPVKYGGWKVPAMSQHTNDTTFAGVWCDINSYEGGVSMPPPHQPGPTWSELLAHAQADIDTARRIIAG